MVTDTDRMVLELSAQMRQFEKAMLDAAGSADRAAQRVERRFEAMNRRTVQDFNRFKQQVTGVLATIGVGLVVRDVTQLADTWTTVGNRLAFAGVQAERLATVQQTVANIARDTRSDLDSTADLFARMYRSSGDLGASLAEVARVTEVVSKALAGAAQSERAGAIRQLGQGLGSGRLQGDELRSILENSRPIAEAIATEFETTVGNLRKLGQEGRLESRRVFQAILRAGDDIDAAFGRTTFTVADAFTRLRTEAARFVGTNDQTSASVRSLTRLIDFLADNLATLADTAVIAATVIGGALAGVAIARAVTALSNMTVTANTARAALAFFGGPLGLILTVAGAGLAYVATQTDLLSSRTELLERAAQSSYTALQRIQSVAEDLGELASETGDAADETDRLASVSEDARQALDDLGSDADDAAERLDGLGQVTSALAEIERQRTLDTIRQAIADQRAVIASTRRAQSIRELTDAFQRAGNGGGAPVDYSDFYTAQVQAAERQLEVFENSLNALAGLEPETWAELYARHSGEAADSAESNARSTRAARTDLEAMAELTLARIRHDEQRVRFLEDALEISKRTQQFEAQGVASAEALARATEQVREERAALNAEAERAYQITQIQDQIEIARTNTNVALVDVLSDQLDIMRRQREIVDQLGVSEEEALKRAREVVEARREAEDAARDRELRTRALEDQREIARARGDERAERAIERRLELEARIYELRKAGVSEEAAADRAQSEVEALERADIQGRWRQWFGDGVRSAMEGDLDDFVEGWWQERVTRATQRALDAVADELFNVFQGVLGDMAQSGWRDIWEATGGTILGDAGGDIGQLGREAVKASGALNQALGAAATQAATQLALSGAASAASAAKEAASSTQKATAAATEIASMQALATAASTAAAALSRVGTAGAVDASGNIVSSIFSSLIGGFRANGGPVSAGVPYIVGERGAEMFVPQVPGFIVPNASRMVSLNYVDRSTRVFNGVGDDWRRGIEQTIANDQRTRRAQVIGIFRDAASRPNVLR